MRWVCWADIGLVRFILGIAPVAWDPALFILVGFVVALWGLPRLASWRRDRRAERVIVRARVQGLVDPAFSDESVICAARRVLEPLEGDQDRGSLAALRELFGKDAAFGMDQRVAGEGRATFRVEVTGIDIVRILDRGEEGRARVVVRVAVRLNAASPLRRPRAVVAYWSFTQRGAAWALSDVEDEWHGKHHTKHDPLETPEADVARLYDRAVIERATSDAVPDSAMFKDLAGTIAGTRVRASVLDLAMVDGRFAPDVIESCVHRLLAAWDQATHGERRELDALAQPKAADQLVQPERGLPRAVREPHLQRLELVDHDPRSDPPTVTVVGRVSRADTWELAICWKLALVDNREHPWRLENANAWEPDYLGEAGRQ